MFTEKHDIVSCFVPVDTQGGANTGTWINLKGWGKCSFVFFKAAGVAPDDPVITLAQATVLAGTDTKAAAIITSYKMKQGAAVNAISGWTTVTQAAATTVTLNGTSAESQGIYVIDIDPADLDTANGFDCIQVSIADTGAAGAQLGAAFYVLSEPRYAGVVTNGAITD